MTWRRGAVLLWALAALLLSMPHAVAAADEAEVVAVGTAAEAWYQSSPLPVPADLCVLPCPDQEAPSPYPEDTLHAGAVLGGESARTYVALDLAALPPAGEIVGGTVHLPLAGPGDGTRDPEQAELTACLATTPVQPAQGAPAGEAPEVDCAVSATAVLVEDADRFELDLAPFAAAWAEGEPNLGLALLPGAGTEEQRATWRVVFHGSGRDTPDAQPITADLQMRTRATAQPDAGGPRDGAAPTGSAADRTPQLTPGFAPAPSTPSPAGSQPEAGLQRPEAASPEEPDLTPPAGTPGAGEPVAIAAAGFAYPQVWLLPLLFLVVGGLLGRSLSEEYEVAPTGLGAA